MPFVCAPSPSSQWSRWCLFSVSDPRTSSKGNPSRVSQSPSKLPIVTRRTRLCCAPWMWTQESFAEPREKQTLHTAGSFWDRAGTASATLARFAGSMRTSHTLVPRCGARPSGRSRLAPAGLTVLCWTGTSQQVATVLHRWLPTQCSNLNACCPGALSVTVCLLGTL